MFCLSIFQRLVIYNVTITCDVVLSILPFSIFFLHSHNRHNISVNLWSDGLILSFNVCVFVLRPRAIFI